jgi:hypothetical protein
LLCAVLPLSITAAALGIALAQTAPADQRLIADSVPITLGLTLPLVAAIVLPLAIALQRGLRRLDVGCDDAMLDLRAGWYHQQIARSDLDADKARIVDLAEHLEYRPALKTNAIALPGYRVGHFRLRDWRRKAFCILTRRERVLMLPQHSGRVLLLSLQRPQALLDMLRGTG